MPLEPAEILAVPSSLTREQMLRSMGIAPGRVVKSRLLRHLDATIESVRRFARPQLAWRMGAVDGMHSLLSPSRRLDRYLEDADHVVVLIGTAGRDMDEMLEAEHDPMRKYVLSVAATALTRYTLEFADRELNRRFPNCSTGKPISPGNDGLPFRLQTDLVGLLPIERFGVAFDPESLAMTPLASITSIIGLGSYRRGDNEGCASCPSRNCPIRLQPQHSQEPDHSPILT